MGANEKDTTELKHRTAWIGNTQRRRSTKGNDPSKTKSITGENMVVMRALATPAMIITKDDGKGMNNSFTKAEVITMSRVILSMLQTPFVAKFSEFAVTRPIRDLSPRHAIPKDPTSGVGREPSMGGRTFKLIHDSPKIKTVIVTRPMPFVTRILTIEPVVSKNVAGGKDGEPRMGGRTIRSFRVVLFAMPTKWANTSH